MKAVYKCLIVIFLVTFIVGCMGDEGRFDLQADPGLSKKYSRPRDPAVPERPGDDDLVIPRWDPQSPDWGAIPWQLIGKQDGQGQEGPGDRNAPAGDIDVDEHATYSKIGEENPYSDIVLQPQRSTIHFVKKYNKQECVNYATTEVIVTMPNNEDYEGAINNPGYIDQIELILKGQGEGEIEQLTKLNRTEVNCGVALASCVVTYIGQTHFNCDAPRDVSSYSKYLIYVQGIALPNNPVDIRPGAYLEANTPQAILEARR